MKILVTGATGFVGVELVRDLISKKHRVFCLVRDKMKAHRLLGDEPELICFDLQKEIESADAFPDEIDAVYHLAGCVDSSRVRDFYEVNVGGTRNLLKHLERNKLLKKIIYLSSLAAVGQRQGAVNTSKPFSPYGLSKLAAECCVEEFAKKKSSVEVLIVRCPVVYGEGQSVLLNGFFQSIARNNLRIPGNGLNIRRMCYLKNLTEGLMDCLEYTAKNNFEIINLADAERYDLKTVIDLISLEMLGQKANVKWLPAFIARMGMLAYKALAILGINNVKLFALATTVADVDCDLKTVSPPDLFVPRFSSEKGVRETVHWLKINKLAS